MINLYNCKNQDIIKKAARILKQGGIVAFPTETVYGLGADASNEIAVNRIYDIKSRPRSLPLIVHIASIDHIKDWAIDVPLYTYKLAHAFWPGPLTLILKKSKSTSYSVTGGQETVGLRLPSNPIALQLLQEFGSAIAAPSANRFGKISPTTARHVESELKSVVDMIIDGGRCSHGIESTIIDLSSSEPRLLRPGAIQLDAINNVLSSIGISIASTKKTSLIEQRAPGMQAAHYAPKAPLLITESLDILNLINQMGSNHNKIVVLAQSKLQKDIKGVVWITMPLLATNYAYEIYARLHEADECLPSLIIIEKPPLSDEWLAINDRLTKAACGSGSNK